jgi:Holliday junction resolvasome RuvABC endonuclease subunit
MKTILTLDLARRLGWCLWKTGTKPTIGTYQLPGPDKLAGVGPMLVRYEKWLGDMIADNDVDFICYEKQIITRGMNKNFQLINLGGMTEKLAFENTATVCTVAVNEWRKHFIGNGGYPGKEAKRLAVQKVENLGYTVEHDDAAEAFGICDYVADQLRIKRDWPNVTFFDGLAG